MTSVDPTPPTTAPGGLRDGQDYTPPELNDTDPDIAAALLDDDAAGDYRGDVRNAIETALAATPKGGAARTLEAKAEHIHEHLDRAGWVLMHPAADERPRLLGPNDQIVTVPEGFVVDVHPLATPGPDLGPLADPELATLADIVAQLEGLDPESRERVAGFVTHRYGPVTPVPVGRPAWLDVTRPPGHDLPLRTGGVIGRPQATRISE